jgi:biotin synthase
MGFDEQGHVIDFGMDQDRVMEIVNLGTPFMTTGCLGTDGQVACNRPFGNCLPDDKQWNYPYPPNEEELSLIRENIFKVESTAVRWSGQPEGQRDRGTKGQSR